MIAWDETTGEYSPVNDRVIQIAACQGPNDPYAKMPVLIGLGETSQIYVFNWLEGVWMTKNHAE